MADGGKDPGTVIKKARLIEENEFQQLWNQVLGRLQGNDRGKDCISQLRKLFLLIAATRRKKRVSTIVIDALRDVVSEPQQGSKKFKLLCSAILREMTPLPQLVISSLDPPVDQQNIPILLPLALTQGKELGYWSNHVPLMIKWITSGGIHVDLQTTSLGCLNHFFFSKTDIISTDDVGLICHQMSHWLRRANTVSAPNPYQRQIFGGRSKGYQAVTEIDGSLSRFFFTVLSIAYYCFPDQVLNVHTFSLLRSWLLNSGAVQANSDEGPFYSPQQGHSPGSVSRTNSPDIPNLSPIRDDSALAGSTRIPEDQMDTISIGSYRGISIPRSVSPSNQSPVFDHSPHSQLPETVSLGSRPQTPLNFPLTDDDVEERPQSRARERKTSRKISFTKLFIQQGPKTGQQELREKTCEYCLRVIEQSERRPAKSLDVVLVEASLVEAVLLLDVLCKCDKSLVPKLIDIVRRLYSKLTGDMNKWKRAVLPVVQFLLNHGESVVFDPEPACKVLFGTMVNAFYLSSSFSFEVVMFCLDNMEKLCTSTSVFTKFFPNLFKILAWSPRTFLREYIELLPVMMSEDSVVEVFHSILDLPCLSAALCVAWASRAKPPSSSSSDASSVVPPSVAAYLDPQYRPLFSFILRPESGHGDTISRLKVLHSLLEDMADHPRVVVSSQIAPALLNLYFTILLEEAELETVSKLIPVILERSMLLFNPQSFKLDIRRIMADKLVIIFQKYPSLVSTHQQDLMEFITGFKNLGSDKEDVFINLVWSIGEFASTAYGGGCTVQTIVQYFETLEALTYEIVMQSASGQVSFSGKLVSVFMTALAKLASRCQDLIQRAIMCCSKVLRHKPEMLSDPDCYVDLVTRAQELIQLLKLPNVAPVILSPDSEWVTGRWHRDKNTSLPLLLQSTKMVLS